MLKFQFRWLQSLVVHQFHLWKQFELGTYTTFDYMNMDWLMVIGIKQKSESKQNEYSRHIFLFTGTNIGNIIITSKYMSYFTEDKNSFINVSGLPLYLFKSFLNLPEATISFIQVIFPSSASFIAAKVSSLGSL